MPNERKSRPFLAVWRSAVFASNEESGAKLALLALAEFANSDDGGDCFPGVGTVALLASVNERTIRRHLDSLDGRGWFIRWRRKGQSWRLWEYRLTLPKATDTVSDPSEQTTGHSQQDDRTLTTEGPGTVSDYPDHYPEQEPERATDDKRAPDIRPRNRGKGQTFEEWMESLSEEDTMEDVLKDGITYAESVGLPIGSGVDVDFTALAWERFEMLHSPATVKGRAKLADAGSASRKLSTNWPGEYRKAIQSAGGGLWAFSREDRTVYLTTKGRQLAIACGMQTTNQ